LDARCDPSNPSAFNLIKEGNRYVGEQCKDKVVQIRSEKSVGSLNPLEWYVVYYDPTATFKASEVKFGGGKMMDVKRPMRLIEAVAGADSVFDLDSLKVDSDAALALALKEPLLAPLTLRVTQFWLQHGKEGPVWKIRIWAAKLARPGDNADIGDLYISAKDGSTVKNDLHIDSVN
jgi:hypothetical protein